MFVHRRLVFILLLGFFPLGIIHLSASSPVSCERPCSIDRRLQDAEAITALNPDWFVMRSIGPSMKPFIQDGDLIIVQGSGFEALAQGMMVVFTDDEGDRVVHAILKEVVEGFVIGGLNNDGADPLYLNRENFIGVVIGILRTDQKFPSIVTKRNHLPVALCKVR